MMPLNKRSLSPQPMGAGVLVAIFIGTWLALNIFQSLFTELFNDEAYYYFYSLRLDWGYYDHPPLIALFIKTGYLLFHNELGVRIGIVILSSLSILLLIRMEKVNDYKLFISLFISILIIQITAFLAVPDSLLFFFSVVFFLAYRRFLERNDLAGTLLLGVSMALLLYSKYHGILIILFTVLSNLRLLKSYRFWGAALLGSMMYVPHLWWQFEHDFPTVYYHLVERSHDEFFRWTNLTDYLAGQVFMMNPLLFPLFVYFLVIFKPETRFDKALHINAIGILCLPLLLVLKGRVESNWSLAAFVPLIMIGYRLLSERKRWHRYIYAVALFSACIILVLRILLIYNFLPSHISGRLPLETHGGKAWSSQVESIAGQRPVVFMGSYQSPSKYMFYSGNESFTFNTWNYRSNQFDLEPIEPGLKDREVVVFFERKMVEKDEINAYQVPMTDSLRMFNGKYRHFHLTDRFRSFNYIPVDIRLLPGRVQPGSVLPVKVQLKNPGPTPIHFETNGMGRVELVYLLYRRGRVVQTETVIDISHLVLEKDFTTTFELPVPGMEGTYYLRVALKTDWLPAGINCRLKKLKVSHH